MTKRKKIKERKKIHTFDSPRISFSRPLWDWSLIYREWIKQTKEYDEYEYHEEYKIDLPTQNAGVN